MDKTSYLGGGEGGGEEGSFLPSENGAVYGDDATCSSSQTGTRSPQSRFTTIGSFTACLTIATLVVQMPTAYRIGCVTSMEKEFSLSSTQSGFVHGVGSLGSILVAFFLAHHTRKRHRPKVLGISVVFGGLATFLYAATHFMTKSNTIARYMNNTGTAHFQICARDSLNDTISVDAGCAQFKEDSEESMGVFLVLVVAALIEECAQTPMITIGLAFIDDNCANKRQTSLYSGKCSECTFNFKCQLICTCLHIS